MSAVLNELGALHPIKEPTTLSSVLLELNAIYATRPLQTSYIRQLFRTQVQSANQKVTIRKTNIPLADKHAVDSHKVASASTVRTSLRDTTNKPTKPTTIRRIDGGKVASKSFHPKEKANRGNRPRRTRDHNIAGSATKVPITKIRKVNSESGVGKPPRHRSSLPNVVAALVDWTEVDALEERRKKLYDKALQEAQERHKEIRGAVMADRKSGPPQRHPESHLFKPGTSNTLRLVTLTLEQQLRIVGSDQLEPRVMRGRPRPRPKPLGVIRDGKMYFAPDSVTGQRWPPETVAPPSRHLIEQYWNRVGPQPGRPIPEQNMDRDGPHPRRPIPEQNMDRDGPHPRRPISEQNMNRAAPRPRRPEPPEATPLDRSRVRPVRPPPNPRPDMAGQGENSLAALPGPPPLRVSRWANLPRDDANTTLDEPPPIPPPLPPPTPVCVPNDQDGKPAYTPPLLADIMEALRRQYWYRIMLRCNMVRFEDDPPIPDALDSSARVDALRTSAIVASRSRRPTIPAPQPAVRGVPFSRPVVPVVPGLEPADEALRPLSLPDRKVPPTPQNTVALTPTQPPRPQS